jgi:hypothetical protein
MMNRYPTEQLMTVEEAERLSELHNGRNRRKQPIRQPSLWAQTPPRRCGRYARKKHCNR